MHKEIFYLIDIAKQLAHGNMEVQIGNHFLKRGEWGTALMWINTAFEKGGIEEAAYAENLQQEIIDKLKR